MVINEKIKAAVVELIGLNGEDLGIVSTKEALKMAKELNVDLVCLSLSSSPPPCQLVQHSQYKNDSDKQKQKLRKEMKGRKTKEIRLHADIEQHDYDTKKRQAEKILRSGDHVQLTVRLERKESEAAKKLVQQLIQELKDCGEQDKGIQVSGKQVIAILKSKES